MPIQSKIVSMYHGNTLWCPIAYEHCSKLMRTSVHTHTFDMHILSSFSDSASHIMESGSSYYYSIIEIVVIGLYSEFGVITFIALSSFRLISSRMIKVLYLRPQEKLSATKLKPSVESIVGNVFRHALCEIADPGKWVMTLS